MSQMVSGQLMLFIVSIIIGIVMGVLFDIFRVIRKIVHHHSLTVQLEDIFYWILCALIGFYILYICNYAEIRVYVFIGMLLGSILYFCTVSILVIQIADWVIKTVKSILNKMIVLIMKPIRQLMRLLGIPITHIVSLKERFETSTTLTIREFRMQQYHKQLEQKTEKFIKNKKD